MKNNPAGGINIRWLLRFARMPFRAAAEGAYLYSFAMREARDDMLTSLAGMESEAAAAACRQNIVDLRAKGKWF